MQNNLNNDYSHGGYNLIYHDIRNLLFAVSGYISIGKYDKAQAKITQICKSLEHNKENGIKISGNLLIENLLLAKKSIMDLYGIKFIYADLLSCKIPIDISDLCSLIGNALDNAIEACVKITDEEKRWVKIVFSDFRTYLTISVSNSVSACGSSSATCHSKSGLGVKSIKSVIDKYNGILYTSMNDQTFFMSMNLQISEVRRIMGEDQ